MKIWPWRQRTRQARIQRQVGASNAALEPARTLTFKAPCLTVKWVSTKKSFRLFRPRISRTVFTRTAPLVMKKTVELAKKYNRVVLKLQFLNNFRLKTAVSQGFSLRKRGTCEETNRVSEQV
ncbi:MAG: hypothetical protein Pg6C_19520 [Treponemataceae bacterium]|nr:MAG: hypothetical protein Pg6C_19520 [Treponemataceae bacterium]